MLSTHGSGGRAIADLSRHLSLHTKALPHNQCALCEAAASLQTGHRSEDPDSVFGLVAKSVVGFAAKLL